MWRFIVPLLLCVTGMTILVFRYECAFLFDLFLMTDSICHSSLPRTVLEKVTLTTIQFRIHPRTKVDPMFQCVYISTPLKSCPYKSSATCAWSMARVAEKTRHNICAKNKGANQPARSRRLISAFVVRYSSFFLTKKRLTNLNGEQNDTWNLLVSHRICHFRAVQPFDYPTFKLQVYHQLVLLLSAWRILLICKQSRFRPTGYRSPYVSRVHSSR